MSFQVFVQETTPCSKFISKPSEATCTCDKEENELVVNKSGKNVCIAWKVRGFTKRKFSFQGDHLSVPLLFTDGACDYLAIGTSNRLLLFDEMGNDSFWQLDDIFSDSVCSALLDLSWAVILSLTPNRKHDSSTKVVYLLLQKKQKRLYFLRGIHQGEHIIYCSSDLPLLVTYDEVLETLSLLICNEQNMKSDGEDLDSIFVDRVDQVFQSTPKELCFFHDEMGHLYLAILDQYSCLYFLQVEGGNWSCTKQNNMQLERLQLKMRMESFISIQSVTVCREEFQDLLCLDKMSSCHVYIGCQWIFRFQVFWISKVSLYFAWMGANESSCSLESQQSSIKSLRESVASRITLELENGHLYRISLDCFRPHTQPTKDMLACSFAALKPELSCVLRSLWIFHKYSFASDAFLTTCLDHCCIEWKSLEYSLDILRKYLMDANEHSLEWTYVVDLLLSKLLSNGEELHHMTGESLNNNKAICDDYSWTSYLARKYSLFYQTWQIPFPWDTNYFQSNILPWSFTTNSIGEMLYSLATVFHLLYECYKTSVTNENHLEAVVRQIKQWTSLLGLSNWMEHYDRDLLHLNGYQRLEQPDSPCCIFDALSDAIVGNFQELNLLKKSIQSFTFRGLYNPLERLEKICIAFERIFQNDCTEGLVSIPSLTRDILPTLPIGLSTPIYDALQVLKLQSNEEDIQIDFKLDFLYGDNFSRLLKTEMETTKWNISHKMESIYMEDIVIDFDSTSYTSGMEVNDPCIDMRFAADRRTMEVQNLLDSASPLSLDSLDLKSLYEDDSITISSNKLLARLQKNLGVCIGRGAFVLGTYVSYDPTEPIVIPKICLAAKAPSDSLPLVKLDISIVSTHYFDWPRFHNGVASSLRFFRREPRDISPETMLSRSWIVSNRPPHPCASHAGVLFGLGLTGHLPVLQTTDWYGYLIERDELTCIGLMLGVACSGRGSMDNAATKMFCIHIRHFNPLSFSQPDWEVPVSVQSAACVSLGLLYQASCHRLMVEGLYAEMTRKMEPDISLEQRQGFCLAVGIGLGFVCLGMGRKSTALQDLHLEEKLYSCIYGKTVTSTTTQINSDSHPNVILEEYTNRDVITPAALMALCFMYLQTNDWSVAKMLTIPETLYELESIRPDHLYLFVLSRQLILWDYIYATPSYLTSLLPNICRHSLSTTEEISLDNLLEQLRLNRYNSDMTDIVVGTIMILLAGALSIGLRYAGTFDLEAYTLIHHLFLCLEKIVPTSISMYIALLPLSLSLIMAGTGNLELLRILRRLQKRVRHQSSDTNHPYANYMMNSMAIGFLFLGGGSCSFQTNPFAIASLLCALYPIFPNSPTDNQYHLQAFRHFYILATENRLLETRDIRTNKPCFVPLEITLKDTKDYYATCVRLMSPCLVPDWRAIEKIQIRGPRYISRTFECCVQTLDGLEKHHHQQGRNKFCTSLSMKIEYGRRIIFVRRRIGQLDYRMDPKGSRGLLSRVIALSLKGRMLTLSLQWFHSLPTLMDNSRDERIATDSLVEYPSLSGFFEYFCNQTKPGIHDAILFQVLSHDKPEALQLYLELMNICNSMEILSLHSLYMKHFSILSHYFHYRPRLLEHNKNDLKMNAPSNVFYSMKHHIMDEELLQEDIPILEPSFVEICFLHVKNELESKHLNWSIFYSAIRRIHEESSGSSCSSINDIMKKVDQSRCNKWLWMYLQLMQIPNISMMRQMYREFKQQMATLEGAYPSGRRIVEWWLLSQSFLPVRYQQNISLLCQILRDLLDTNLEIVSS